MVSERPPPLGPIFGIRSLITANFNNMSDFTPEEIAEMRAFQRDMDAFVNLKMICSPIGRRVKMGSFGAFTQAAGRLVSVKVMEKHGNVPMEAILPLAERLSTTDVERIFRAALRSVEPPAGRSGGR